MEAIAKYVYQIYKNGSFSKAAKELYISQPSLSAAVSRFENEVGFRIFDRTTIPCTLTSEGRIYIDSIEATMDIENNMKERIKKLSDTEGGSITVGGSSFASYLIISEICSEFYKKYPQTKVTIDIGNTGSYELLWDKLGSKQLDILVTYVNNNPKFIIEPLLEERMVIAMNKNMQGADKLKHLALTKDEILTESYSPDREISDMSIFKDVEFLDFSKSSHTKQQMIKLLGNFKTSNYRIQNSRHSEMHYNLMCGGIAALLTSTLAIAQKPYDKDILFFVPKSKDSYRKIFLAYNYYSSDNPVIKDYISLAKEIYSSKK